jgi:hypothetical protein
MFGRWGEPAFVVVFGPVGIGKSTDVALFDPEAWTLGAPGCVKGAEKILGPDRYAALVGRRIEAQNIDHAIGVLNAIAAGQLERRTVLVDDLSLLAEAETVALKSQISRSDTRYLWDVFASKIILLKTAMRRAGVHVLASCHMRSPSTDEKGKFTPGGPSMGGPKGTMILATEADVIYGLERDPACYPYPAAYRCEYPSQQWAYKDRYGALLGTAPANLREILRTVDAAPPRPAGLEWLDDAAESVASTPGNPRDVGQEAYTRLRSHVGDGPAFWAVRDGLARRTLRERKGYFDTLLAPAEQAAMPALGSIPAAGAVVAGKPAAQATATTTPAATVSLTLPSIR